MILAEFEYKGTLPTANEIIQANRSNFYVGAKQKKQFTKAIAYKCLSQKIPKIDKKFDIYCYWYRKDSRTDKDNISGGIKFILDGMQKAGVIKNDGWKEIGNIFHYFKKSDENKVVVILKEHEEVKI